MNLAASSALPCLHCGARQDLAVWLDQPGRVWLGDRLVELVCDHCEALNHAEFQDRCVVWGSLLPGPRRMFRPESRSEYPELTVKGSPSGLTLGWGQREWFLPRRIEADARL